ncbi:hypothetical protein PAT3040_02689 [Paenibacillus agaridevorans]|uniref:Uncharacterized protein n=1 Tax=Paenibacillus agaridevorans TaxID=171404 RepID=A0A2R5EXP2_9BACL|nr:hypothetical protein PAT3040_02689 [Paenibacillus agaridevorans]
MPAGHNKRQARISKLMLKLVGINMTRDMMRSNQRNVQRERQTFCRDDAYEQRPDQPGSLRDRNSGHIL